ncbi:hypothetical protein FBU31_006577 [Coemansia sp. 'formosensis']|nr:hypothetical protein FBU31_006577 [Coemansia sp. 'formosensis']
MPPAASSSNSSRRPHITTVEEYDQDRSRKRQLNGHTHKHHGIAPLPTHARSKTEQRQQQSGIFVRRAFYRVRQFMSAIMRDSESRSIFAFLVLNLSYMFVQIVYGYLSNSLGLISDAIHMLFDCMALAIGLIASVMSKWPPSESFTFGYDRIEILSGFSNGVFLMLISVSIFFEAIERLIHPPEMNTHRLLLVSFGGLAVNLFGMAVFGHHHHHGSQGCSHGHDHDNHGHDHDSHSHTHDGHDNCGHSHDHDSHGHSSRSHEHGTPRRSQNMQGVFLHVLADTLGSVGVIISTLLIQWFGWTGFDPLASIAIASLIFASVVPLVRDSMHMLLLRLPDDAQTGVQLSIDQIHRQVGGISAISRAQFWPVTEARIMGVIHVKVDPNYVRDKDERLLCAFTMRDVASAAIGEICRSNIPGLHDVFVNIDDATQIC